MISHNPFMFRNDVGMGYVGGRSYVARKDGMIHVKKGDRVVINPGIVHYGLLKGSADFIGWNTQVVTPDMVGKKIAVFQSIEIKTAKDCLSKEQRAWNRAVRKAGGIAEVWKESDILKGEVIE
jgi:hypothetical protein